MKEKKIRISTGIFILVACIVMSFIMSYFFFANKLSSLQEKEKLYSKIESIDKIVRKKYINEIDEEKLNDGMAMGYIAGITDKYASYMDKKTYGEYIKDKEGRLIGIGVNVEMDKDSELPKIIHVMQNSPALKANLKRGDIITKVDGEDILKLGYNNALNKIKGEAGTVVKLTIKRTEADLSVKEYEIPVNREEFDVVHVESRMIENDIGYIKISEFEGKISEEFKKAMDALTKNGAKKFIFDVRYNPGGDLQQIIKTLDPLLPEGPILKAVDKNNKEEVYSSDAAERTEPMVVLVNDQTASAAELFTAALRDYDKCEIVGIKTYGKGTMQSIIPLSDGTAIDFSTHMYNPPKGENYEGKGIEPNYTVEMPKELQGKYVVVPQDKDAQLLKAIEVIKTK